MKTNPMIMLWLSVSVLAMPVAAKAQDTSDYVWGTNNSNEIYIRFYMNCLFGQPLRSITIPETITGLPVASYVPHAFAYSACLTNIIIPDSIKSINASTFYGCQYLASVTIGSGVTDIQVFAFADIGNAPSWPNHPPPDQVGFYFRGDAPRLLDSRVFDRDPKATVYYLPGTTGWSNTFGGLPTAVWQPKMQLDSNSGDTNALGFKVSWASGKTVVVEACTNLSNPEWTAIQTNTLTTGSFYFSDPQWKNYPSQAYRIRSL